MEPLWSPAVATGGKRCQLPRARTGRKQAKTVALGCDRLPRGAHGKEGVDGSSPSEGSAKAAQIAAFSVAPTCTVFSTRWVWSRLWSLQVSGPSSKGPFSHSMSAVARAKSAACRCLIRTFRGRRRNRSRAVRLAGRCWQEPSAARLRGRQGITRAARLEEQPRGLLSHG
jgi:hypothetical protein